MSTEDLPCMKRILFPLLLICGFSSALGQNVYIPDPNFRTFLQSNYAGCMVGDSLDTQCNEVTQSSDLNVSGLGISDLTGAQYFISMNYLICSSNDLTWLPPLNAQLYTLNCENNQLVELPELPEGLNGLYCGDNQLSELPDLPESLWSLFCENNVLTALPSLPNSLWELHAWNNLLTQLPSLEHINLMESYILYDNLIEVLPPFPNTDVHWLECQNNNLQCVPVLPEGTYYFRIAGNEIECIPNLPEDINIDLNLPLCTSNNTHDCNFLRQITGVVYNDENQNCLREISENGLANRVVGSSNGAFAVSDAQGNYELYLDSGNHTVTQFPLNAAWAINCPAIPYEILVDSISDTIPNIDFPNIPTTPCHWLWVDVGSSNQRPCFSNNMYSISYCNYGSAAATGVFINLEFPTHITPVSSGIPWQNLGNGLYQFDIGNLDIDECGSFNIIDSVSCEAEVGNTYCVQAQIYPQSPCLTGTPSWDNSSLNLSADCIGTEIEFTITNSGTGNMTSPSSYRVYEDNALFVSNQSVQLIAGVSIVLPISATGRTYRMEVDQSIGHPGNSQPRVNVEGCGGPFMSIGQIIPSYQDDVDDYVEINCTELSAAYDPNDKTVQPSGYGANHLINPRDSLLEYRIRFQNTGTDTAFTVEIVDSLPMDLLNASTFLSGVSSHPYHVRMHGNGIVTWRFENILLPDSSTNETESHGFVKFKIRTKSSLPNGTVLNNSAAIYFDFNSAILTNTSFLTISDIPIIASSESFQSLSDLTLYPNPFFDKTTIKWKEVLENGRVEIHDMVGRKVLDEPVVGKTHIMEKRGLSSGMYLISVYDGKRLIGTVQTSVIER